MNPAPRICAGKNTLRLLDGIIRSLEPSSVFVLCDHQTRKHCVPLLGRKKYFHFIEVPPGESSKSLESCNLIWQELIKHHAGREAVLVNVGGGMICDLGGFAASVYKRGIRFIHVPTTLLSQADAAIGGKTGVDYSGIKNLLGTFQNPAAVIADPVFLKTLPPRELRSGFAEIIKHCLVADKKKFRSISKSEQLPADWSPWIRHAVKIKTGFTSRDPLDQNMRKALNFGHTLGHAVESLFLNDEKNYLLHGEAVAAGMIAESFLSFLDGGISLEELNKITDVVVHFFSLPVIDESYFDAIWNFVLQDKKNSKPGTGFTLLDGIGNFKTGRSVAKKDVVSALQYYNYVIRP